MSNVWIRLVPSGTELRDVHVRVVSFASEPRGGDGWHYQQAHHVRQLVLNGQLRVVEHLEGWIWHCAARSQKGLRGIDSS